MSSAFLGNGLLRPFQRDRKNDFANGSDVALITSNVGQILGTMCATPNASGEIPWRSSFGSKFHLLRHKNYIRGTTEEIARVYASEAISRWEPRARVARVEVSFDEKKLSVRVIFDVLDKAGNIVVKDQETRVSVGL